jgi:6-phosphogluconolactonase
VKASAPVLLVKESPAAAAELAAERFCAIVSERALASENVNVALCGGTTPGELYRRLAALPLSDRMPWDKLQFFFGDERDVPQDHVENNYRLTRKTLLDHVPIPVHHVHPMPADSRDLAAAAEQYENLIRRLVPPRESGDDTPCFDLVLLGMGGEGHTASLFPDTPALSERRRLVVSQYVPVIGRNRMTFTFPLINAARYVMFFVTGSDKAPAIAAVLSDDQQLKTHYPASRVQPTRGELIFVLDATAARNVIQK